MLKNIGSNWALNVVQILVFMVLSPFVVRALGRDVNGVWQSIVALAGPLQLLILGIPMASVRFIAEHVSKDDREGANAAVSTCLAICLTMGLAALIVGSALYLVFEYQYLASPSWSTLGPATLADARIAFAVFVITVTVGFAARLPYGIFEAHHDFVRRNLVVGGGFLLKLVLTVTLLSMRASLVLLAAVQVTCIAVEFGVALWLVRHTYPDIRFGLAAFNRSMVRSILSFSVFAMLLNVGAQLAFRTDALVIGWFRSPGAVTVYDIGNKIFEPFTNLILGIGMVVMPLATALHARGQASQLEGVFEKWTKIAFSIVLAIGLYLLVLGPEFLAWWFGDEYDPESGLLLRILMGSFLVFLPVRGVALPILMGLGRPVRPAVGLLCMGILNVGLSVLLIGPLGLTGVALGTAVPNVLYAVFVFLAACRQLDVRPLHLLRYAGGRALLGALPAALLLFGIQWRFTVSGLVELVLAGLAFVTLFALAQVLFVFRGDAHLDLHSMVARRLRPATGSEG